MSEPVGPRDSTVGSVAIVLAALIIASVLSLVAFFVVGGAFGLINDAGNGLIGILSGALALLLPHRAGGWPGVAAAIIGAAVAMWGSWLVMSGATGFVLAGFVSTVGFGFIGAWLALLAWSPMAGGWPTGLRSIGRIAGAAMVIGGVVAVPGALMRIDDFDAMPPWLWPFAVGWLGTYVLYPAWALWFGGRR